jgi:hemerythrin-like metal-binding protein
MDNVEKLLEIWEKYFKYEDDLMEQYKYSSCDEHKKEHDDFRESILTLKKMYSKGFKYVLNTLAISLNQWVEEHIKHIAGKDRELGKFLNSKGVT